MRVDYHLHLRAASSEDEGAVDHSVAAIERYVERAAARGVDEIGISEHGYYFRELGAFAEHPYQRERVRLELEPYVTAVVAAKDRGLPVKLGLEVDWFPGHAAAVAEALAPYPWDYLLGSVHVVDGEAVDMEPGLWARLPVERVWERYFEELAALAASGLVDTLAHPDLVKIFGMRPAGSDVARCHEAAADAIAAGGVALEISTAGLRKRVRELYPAPGLLEACAARGVPVTLASDAHLADDVGRDLDRAVELARSVGYETVTVFAERRAHQEPLA